MEIMALFPASFLSLIYFSSLSYLILVFSFFWQLQLFQAFNGKRSAGIPLEMCSIGLAKDKEEVLASYYCQVETVGMSNYYSLILFSPPLVLLSLLFLASCLLLFLPAIFFLLNESLLVVYALKMHSVV